MKRAFRTLALVLAAAIVLALVFHDPVLAGLGSYLVHADTPEKADIALVLAGDSEGERDREHLHRPDPEDDESGSHRRGQRDSGDEIIRKRRWIEGCPVKPGCGSSQHPRIVGNRHRPSQHDPSMELLG